ncbi:MAG: LTA synthase family protein [Bacteroidales bacterium]
MSNRLKGNIYFELTLNILLIYGLFTLCRIFFLLVNLDYFQSLTPEGIFWIFIGGLKFDTAGIFYVNSLYIVLMAIPFAIKYNSILQNMLKCLFIITNSIALAANCIDTIYFQFTLRRTTATVFHEFKSEVNFLSLIPKFLADYWYAVAFWIMLTLLIVFSYRKARINHLPKTLASHFVYFINGFLIFIIITAMMIGGIRGGFRHSTRPITLSNAGKYVNDPIETTIVLNTPFSILRTLGIKPLSKVQYFKSEKELENVYSPLHSPPSDAEFSPQNIVVIILESIGQEYIGSYNQHLKSQGYKGYTPFLDSLIDNSLMFRNAFANGRKSIDVLPSVLTSIPMIIEPYVLTPYSSNRINSFATLLKPEGYHTSFFHGAPNGSMGLQAYVKLVGFDHYYGMSEFANRAHFDGMWGIWDEEFLQFFAEQINQFPEPFFTSVFTVSSHHPFKIPTRYKGVFPKGTLPIHQCVGYTDFALKRFFETASQMPWFKNTLFVITADHPNQPSFPEYANRLGGYKVPIVMYKPDNTLTGTCDKVVQHIDILPTVLGILNYNKPFFAFGKDALSQDTKPFAIYYSNSAYQLIIEDSLFQFDGNQLIGVFNIKKDKMLKNNLIGLDPEKYSDELKFIKAFIQQYNNRVIDDRMLNEP